MGASLAARCAAVAMLLCALPAAADPPTRWEWLPGYSPDARPKAQVAALPRATADRADEVSGPQIHVMYVLPSDGLDESLDTNGRVGTSVVAFERWLQQQTPTRTLRLDTFQGIPDITFWRAPRTDAQYRATGAYVRTELENDLRAAGMIRNDKLYAVYYGGSSNYSCGGGAYPPTLPGNVAAIYLKGEPPGSLACATQELGAGPDAPGYFEFAMLHELMHTLGFVAACAPHQYLSGHVSDSANDLMWSGSSPWQLPPRLDIGNDDYYEHAIAGCLDFDDSAFLVGPDPPRLGSISTRMQVLTGDNVLIGGFVISGTTPKTVVINARGPSLASQGVSGVLADPVLQLVSGDGSVVTNDNWTTATYASQLRSLGLAPPDAHESSILATLAPGAYTAIVTGVGGGTGVGIVEVFEVDRPDSPLTGISTRGRVLTGDNVLIGGFIISGASPQTVVVRARGPSLASQGVADPLLDPVLQLVKGADGSVLTNDNWQSAGNATQLQATGYAPSDARESALLVTLNPGAYTAIVSGAGGSTGVAIVEVYTP